MAAAVKNRLQATLMFEQLESTGTWRGSVTWKGETYGPVPIGMVQGLLEQVVVEPLEAERRQEQIDQYRPRGRG